MIKTPELFDFSNKNLKQIEFDRKVLPQIALGEFWRYFEGMNIGQEISKHGNMRRPCLIYKIIPDSSLLWIIPTTSNIYIQSVFHISLPTRTLHGLPKESILLLHQMKCIDKKRLIKKIQGKKGGKGLIQKLKFLT